MTVAPRGVALTEPAGLTAPNRTPPVNDPGGVSVFATQAAGLG
jgi:hypothetical protein